MSLSDEDLVFRGIDGVECEEFIRAVNIRARREGKTRDNEWIVDFVSICFAGKALRWYRKLDREIRGDWDKLQDAMLDEYPEEEERSTIPTPAAAPLGQSSVVATREGRIKVVSSNLSVGNYVSCTLDPKFGVFLTCSDASNALQVRLPATGGPFEIEFINSPSHDKMVVVALKKDQVVPGVSSAFALVATTKGSGSTNSTFTSFGGHGPVQSSIWRTADNGCLVASWKQDNDHLDLFAVVYVSTKRVLFHSSLNGLPNTHCTVTLVFEPI